MKHSTDEPPSETALSPVTFAERLGFARDAVREQAGGFVDRPRRSSGQVLISVRATALVSAIPPGEINLIQRATCTVQIKAQQPLEQAEALLPEGWNALKGDGNVHELDRCATEAPVGLPGGNRLFNQPANN